TNPSPLAPLGLSAVGDLDGDGWTDALLAGSTGGEVDVVRGRSGVFAQPPSVGTGIDPEQVALAGVTGGGKRGRIVLARGDHRIELRPGAGDGTFGAPLLSDLPTGPRRFAVADLDRDGVVDLAVVSDVTPTVSVLRGTGNGFGSRTDFASGGPISDI